MAKRKFKLHHKIAAAAAVVVAVCGVGYAATTIQPSSCGVERWDVKTGTDSVAKSVKLNQVTPTTIAKMVAIPAPQHPTSRVAPVETTVYSISATLTGFKSEGDSDYHLVISDGINTMIVEIPSPDCVSSSPFASDIAKTRLAFEKKEGLAGKGFKKVSQPVTVTGVGFFDKIHGQTGVAPNGIELHPALSIVFK